MNKPFLLIAGLNYYPQSGTSDWIGCYETREEAESMVKKILIPKRVYLSGPRKGQVRDDEKHIDFYVYFIDGYERDWYEVVDLREWV